MNDPIIIRQAIAEDADRAAQRCVLTGVNQENPHERGTDAQADWQAAYERYLVLHSAPADVEGGA